MTVILVGVKRNRTVWYSCRDRRTEIKAVQNTECKLNLNRKVISLSSVLLEWKISIKTIVYKARLKHAIIDSVPSPFVRLRSVAITANKPVSNINIRVLELPNEPCEETNQCVGSGCLIISLSRTCMIKHLLDLRSLSHGGAGVQIKWDHLA